MKKLCVGIPLTESVRGEVYFSHLATMIWISKNFDLVIPVVYGVYPHDRAREEIMKQALESGCDLLFFLDADMEPPPGAVKHLLAVMEKTGAAMVSAHTYRRGYPYTSTWSRHGPDGMTYQVTADPGESFTDEIDGCGLACNLIDLNFVREKLKQPYFYMGPMPDGSRIWEDAFFCKTIREAGGKIFADPWVRCGHLSTGVVVNDDNHEQLRKWHLEQDKARIKNV